MQVERERITMRDAELVVLEPGGDVRVRAGIDIGVDAKGYGRDLAHRRRDPVEALELGSRFDVEAQDVVRQREAHLRFALADTGKDDPLRRTAGSEHARKLAAGDDVEAAAEPREQIEYREIAVRLRRVADQRIGPGEGLRVGAPGGGQRDARIHEARRADRVGDGRERDRFGAEHAVAIVEGIHWRGFQCGGADGPNVSSVTSTSAGAAGADSVSGAVDADGAKVDAVDPGAPFAFGAAPVCLSRCFAASIRSRRSSAFFFCSAVSMYSGPLMPQAWTQSRRAIRRARRCMAALYVAVRTPRRSPQGTGMRSRRRPISFSSARRSRWSGH